MLDACLRQLATRGEAGLAGADDGDGYRLSFTVVSSRSSKPIGRVRA
jgi:hypothetical protein